MNDKFCLMNKEKEKDAREIVAGVIMQIIQ